MKSLKFKFFFTMALIFGVLACESDDDEDPIIETRIVERDIPTHNVTFNMIQRVNGNPLQLNTSDLPYQNALNQNFKVSKLRYLISDITFHKQDGSNFTIEGYHFVDVSDSSSLEYAPVDKIPAGTYERISLTFGFDRIDNIDGAYPDLNALNWAWPSGVGGSPNLGGGYHFMQLEGMYDSAGTQKPFNTHMGTARNNTVSPTTYEDNHFIAQPLINPISVNNDFDVTIVMNVEQWYEDPYNWDFNVYDIMIMPNYDAQRKLNLNGPTVFSIE